ncbi:pentapeptide MXKDX repeat protein [Rhodanobacter sp. Root627]|uniref:pentapeptide MXKDX repeat protein n=1 Tax=Rhodanobacter sp. Root627 TaxID=1736572 RepID=UPI001F33989F|nr:pentapeptide MXKDX repeat protein [Rhodanobacter sp. Root627]
MRAGGNDPGRNHGRDAGEERDGDARLHPFPAGVNAMKTTLFAALILAASGLAFTSAFAQDAMAPSSSTAMVHGDAMHANAMKGAMSHDAMQKNSMQKDGMKMDAMHHGAMKHDAGKMGAMKKAGMKKTDGKMGG